MRYAQVARGLRPSPALEVLRLNTSDGFSVSIRAIRAGLRIKVGLKVVSEEAIFEDVWAGGAFGSGVPL